MAKRGGGPDGKLFNEGKLAAASHKNVMFETELKFQVPPESVAAVRAAMAKAAPRRQHLRATYFDTAEGELAKAGIALRLRQEGARRVQTLKARGAHVRKCCIVLPVSKAIRLFKVLCRDWLQAGPAWH